MKAGTFAAIVILGWWSGCAFNPLPAETQPAVGIQDVRIVEGIGGSKRYTSSVEVDPGDLVQIRTQIAHGQTVDIAAPEAPADRVEIVATGEKSSASTELRAAGDRPISISGADQFFPGGVGIQNLSDEAELRLRVSVPRLPGAEQGLTGFRFTTKVVTDEAG
ncbi:MAG: hypothetical protein ACR2OC_01715 [Solirubrobacterales bacterium]